MAEKNTKTECGARCVMHDECDSACALPAGHPESEPHKCQFALAALEAKR